MKRYLSLVLSVSILFGTVPFIGALGASGNESASEETEAAFAFSDIAVNIGADRTKMNFTWYQNTPDESFIYVVKVSELENGDIPADAVAIPSLSVAAYDEGQYSNKASADGLEPETEYAYKIVCGENESAIYTFTTGAQKEFSFIFAGDPQIASSGNLANDTASWKETLRLIDENEVFSDISFMLSAGDHVETYNNETHFTGYLDQTYLPGLPTVNVIGNHDASGVSFAEHFNLPNISDNTNTSSTAGNNYSFVYNDVLFIVLNANRANYAYHKAFIEEARAAHPEAEWTVVTMHQSVFGVAYHANQTASINMRNGFVPVFDECDVDIVLMGHDHVYCRTFMMDGLNPMTDVSVYDDPTYTSVTDPEGILYVTSNSASGSKYYDFAFAGSIFPFVAVQNQEHVPNVSKVYFTDTEFSITTYRTTDMSVVDTFTINRTPDADDKVEELIEAIGTVTLESEDDIGAARSAYDGLTAAEQIKVYNYAALTAAETELKSQKEDSQAAANAEALILAIGTVTLESEDAIAAARSAYDALTDAQKAKVTNYAVLSAAEARLKELKEAENTEMVYIAESVDLTLIVPESATAGSEITVKIAAVTDADKAQAVEATDFRLDYDRDMLTFVGMEPVSPFDGELYVVDDDEPLEAVFAYANNASNGVDPAKVIKGTPTVIAEAKFKVGTTVGTADISISDGFLLLTGDSSYDGYTPALTDASGNVEITRALEIDFILKQGATEAESYAVLASGTKIAVIKADTNDTVYTYGGTTFFFSERFGGYAGIVGDNVSADDIASGVAAVPGKAEVLTHNGDVSGDGNIMSGDAAMLSAMLHRPDGAYSDFARLSADVTDGVSYVTTADAMWILKESVGLN